MSDAKKKYLKRCENRRLLQEKQKRKKKPQRALTTCVANKPVNLSEEEIAHARKITGESNNTPKLKRLIQIPPGLFLSALIKGARIRGKGE